MLREAVVPRIESSWGGTRQRWYHHGTCAARPRHSSANFIKAFYRAQPCVSINSQTDPVRSHEATMADNSPLHACPASVNVRRIYQGRAFSRPTRDFLARCGSRARLGLESSHVGGETSKFPREIYATSRKDAQRNEGDSTDGGVRYSV